MFIEDESVGDRERKTEKKEADKCSFLSLYKIQGSEESKKIKLNSDLVPAFVSLSMIIMCRVD